MVEWFSITIPWRSHQSLSEKRGFARTLSEALGGRVQILSLQLQSRPPQKKKHQNLGGAFTLVDATLCIISGCAAPAQEHVAEFNQWTARRTGRQVVQRATGLPPGHQVPGEFPNSLDLSVGKFIVRSCLMESSSHPKVAESTKAYCSKLAPQIAWRACLYNIMSRSFKGEPVRVSEVAPGCSRRFPIETSADHV